MTIKLDQLDKEIIDLLTKDGRMSCAEIARAIGSVSERSVRYRLEKLLADNIIRINATPVPQALGYSVVADVFIEVEVGQVLEIAHKIAAYENVSYVACSTGEADISVQIITQNNRELYEFVTDVLGKIPGVRKTTTSMVPFIIKDMEHWRIPSSIYRENRLENENLERLDHRSHLHEQWPG
jgi:Lrp/AsnC family transcriptional regulator, regulator for asnA, asnC and gidA